jgi:Phosphotransferase enzyme family
MGIPAGVGEDLLPWLAGSLASHGSLQSVDTTRIGEGAGFVGQLVRARLSWSEARPGAPTSVIVKMPTTDPNSKMMGQMMGLYDREARFYTELRDRVPVRTPRCFYSHADSTTGEYALVLEDLLPMRAGDQVTGATIDDARLVVRELAALHAAFYRPGALDGLDWLPGLIGPNTGMIVPMFEGSWASFVEHYGPRLSPKVMRWTETFAPRIPAWMERFADLPTTMVHGDFRLDNMFFDGPKFALIDWQMIMRVPGSSDLVYFLLTNLTTETRRAHERELIDLYLHTLRARGVGEDLLPRDAVVTGYVEGAMMFAVMFVSTIAYERANARGEAFFDALVERTFTAVEDLDAGAALGLD